MNNILQNSKGNIILIVLVIAAIGGLVFFMPQLSKNFSNVIPQSQSEAPTQAPAPKGEVSLMLDPATITAAAGQTFTVEVKVDTKDDALSAAELYVTFDPAYLEAKSITAGSPLPVELQKGKVEEGKASIVVGSQPSAEDKKGYNGMGSLAKITFMAKKAGMTEIKLDTNSQANAVGKTGNVVSSHAGTSVDIK